MFRENENDNESTAADGADADGKNVVNPPKGGSPKKGIYLESLRFFRHFIVLKFKSTEDEYDVSKLSVRELKKLLDPSTKTPQVKKPRQRASALQDLLKQALEAIAALLEDNAALRIQLKELSEKIMLFQGGVSPVAETETPADVIAPAESTSGGESIDALLVRIESSFLDDVPAAAHVGAEQ